MPAWTTCHTCTRWFVVALPARTWLQCSALPLQVTPLCCAVATATLVRRKADFLPLYNHSCARVELHGVPHGQRTLLKCTSLQGWGGRVLEDLPGAEYLGRLTRLALGSMEEPSWNHPIDISPLEGAALALARQCSNRHRARSACMPYCLGGPS